ncbi:MAG: outer membrane protein assembly factor BamE, partial [Comamonas sp.]|nr:outer membrane protein assembly factor BamE [Comamonas sp.]
MGWLAGAASVLALLSACDQQRIDALEEGLATEADVRAQFGEPATIWPERDGSRTLEY